MLQNPELKAEPVFSIELFRCIIQELVGDKQSLHACSLVSKSFAQLAQEILFHTIKIKSFGSAEKSDRREIVQLFDNAPRLWKYVKHVKFALALRFKENIDWPIFQQDGHSFTLHESFPNIKALTITHWNCRRGRKDTCTGCHLADQLLVDFSSSQMLRTIALEGMNGLSATAIFGLRTPSLQVLSLRLCSFSGSESPLVSDTTTELNMKELTSPLKYLLIDGVTKFPIQFLRYKAKRLVHLRISGHNTLDPKTPTTNSTNMITFDQLKTAKVTGTNTRFLAAFCPAIGSDEISGNKVFPMLSHLQLEDCVIGGSMEGIHKVLHNVQALEKISLTLGQTHIESNWEYCDLSPCLKACHTTLREIYFSTIICVSLLHGQEFGMTGTPQVMVDALTAVRGQNAIEVVNIKCAILRADRLGEHAKDPNFDTQWERFDALLLDNRAADFPSLRKVTLRLICVMSDVTGDSWLLQNFMKDPLRRLYSSTDIQFNCRIQYTKKLD